MATIDLSRSATDFRKHYKSVRAQQGRVFIDDDYNENERIHGEDERRSRVDIIGPAGTPDNGFLITNPTVTGGHIDFDINPGTFYLGGLHLELEQLEKFQVQSDWLQFSGASVPAPPAGGSRFDLVYLESWLQAVSAVEDSELFEVALAGPDTSTRMRIMRRVHVDTGALTGDCRQDWKTLTDSWTANNLGTLNNQNELVVDTKLTVEFEPGTNPDDLCSPPVAGGYLGAENQAIRVQLVDATHFTWGFDNAAPLYRVQVSNDGAGQRRVITMLNEPKDQAHWPLAGQIVELLPWSAVLPNKEKLAERRGFLARVAASFDPDTKKFSLAASVPATFGEGWTTRPDEAQLRPEFFYLRVWNRGSDTVSPPAMPFVAGTSVTLGQTGLKITITGNDRQPGDHWIIAARPESPNRVVPWLIEAGRGPHGYRRFFAPLAVIEWTVVGNVIAGKVIHDCRETFPPLTRLRNCCTYTVGDGVNSFGTFTKIQDAIDHLPAAGGEICVLPGNYEENVRISARRNITIKGCGTRSRVFSPPRGNLLHAAPVIHVIGSQNIKIQSLLVEADDTGVGILIEGAIRSLFSRRILALPTLDITLENLLVRAATRSAIEVQVAYNVTIRRCRIEMKDVPSARPGIFFIGEDSLIEENVIIVADVERRIGGFDFINPLDPNLATRAHAALGGLQLGGTCERIRVINNVIARGIGNGITLGSLRTVDANGNPLPDPEPEPDPCDPCRPGDNSIPPGNGGGTRTVSAGDLYEILIERNRIFNMGLNGIGVVGFFDVRSAAGTPQLITVNGLHVLGNEISRCLGRPLADISAKLQTFMGYGGISLASVLDLIVRDNFIEDNGPDYRQPVCGIFLLHGEGVDISRNLIQNNGARTEEPASSAKAGPRGGIFIASCLAPSDRLPQRISQQGVTLPNGVPALKVHENVVTAPLGRALTAMALGPVSVVGNQFTSREIEEAQVKIATVLIVNLGRAIDDPSTLKSFQALNNGQQDTADPAVGRVNAPPPAPVVTTDAAVSVPRQLINGSVLFTNNQCMLQSIEARGLLLAATGRVGEFDFGASVAIATLDDIGFHDNQCECLLAQARLLTDVALLGLMSVRASDNRFKEILRSVAFSAITLGRLNMTTDNQATHCLLVIGPSVTKVDTPNTILVQPDICRRFNLLFQNFGK